MGILINIFKRKNINKGDYSAEKFSKLLNKISEHLKCVEIEFVLKNLSLEEKR